MNYRRILPATFRQPRQLFTVLLVLLTLKGWTQSPQAPPAAYPAGVKTNYVRTWDATAPEQDPNALMGRSVRDVQEQTAYFDGLGRLLQTVSRKASLTTVTGTNVDMVSPVVYDAYSRVSLSYLPYASTATDATKDNGSFKTDPFNQQASFYGSGNPAQNPLAGQGQTWYYGKTEFEASPLGRVEKQMAPGNSWAGSERGVVTKQWLNTSADDVKKWSVTDVNGTWGTINYNGTYSADLLYKTSVTDEDGKQVITFTDKEGKTILKKVRLTANADNGAGSNHENWLCTYYIYDALGLLRCVIQPEGVELLRINSWNINAAGGAILTEQCFRYEYDERGRMSMKKVPGAGEVYMVYDARDRLVMTQDANLRTITGANPVARWLVTLYDAMNRPVMTGLMKNTNVIGGVANRSFAQHGAAASGSTTYPFSTSATPASTYWELLTQTFYDNYDWVAANGNMFSINRSTADDGLFLAPGTTPPYAQALTQSFATRGAITGTMTKVLGTASQYLWAINYYDDRGRIIQAASQNITGGTEVVTTQFDFAGKMLKQHLASPKNFTVPRTDYATTSFVYDVLGRVVETKHQVKSYTNSTWYTGTEKTISTNEYNSLGQLSNRKLSPDFGGAGIALETQKTDYNIRGWLIGMNGEYAKAGDNTNNYFGYELAYDRQAILAGSTELGSFNTAVYNGNIAGSVWKSRGDGERRRYDYGYDNANRLLKADFTQYTGAAWSNAAMNFSVKMGDGLDPNTAYDYNGNIRRMQQWGLKGLASQQIDDLRYTYESNSNKLKNVIDFTNDAASTLGDFKTIATHPQAAAKASHVSGGTPAASTITDYSYDVNGNLTLDHNKAISSITYNHLNLPHVITVTGKGTITYTYDAAGNKLKKVTVENGATVPAIPPNYTTNIITTTTYVGGAVYESKQYSALALDEMNYPDRLQFIGQPEGRVRWDHLTNAFHYDYMLKDHLGNVRALLTEEQQTIYYPATTLEGTFNPTDPNPANSLVNTEWKYYKIDPAYITDEVAIASWGIETAGNTKLYHNHNGNPPPNTAYPSGVTPSTSSQSSKLYSLNATTNKTGLEFVMKVMAGDKIDIFAKSYYLNTGTINNTNSTPLDVAGLLANLVAAPGNAMVAKGATAANLLSINSSLIPGSFFRGSNGETTTVPKAYVNFMLFDEQFKYIKGGFSRVGTSGVVTDHWQAGIDLQAITADKNGYIFVYVSNESNVPVFFDNLQVIHKPGPILEETHYYPFGLTMAGISNKMLQTIQNKFGWNGGSQLGNNEFFDGEGLELYETFFRTLDPQIGRFWQIDPEFEAQEVYSPYESMGNNPITNVDPLGDFKTKFGAKWHRFWNGGGTVGENEYGEWYVTKGEIVDDECGDPIAKSWKHYGEGRNKYSAAREALLRDVEFETDIMMNGGRRDEAGNIVSTGASIHHIYNTPGEANDATLSLATGVVIPNPVGKSVSMGINGRRLVAQGKKIVQKISKKISLKQIRHLAGTAKSGGGYLANAADAQKVLDAIHSGEAIYLGATSQGHHVFRYNGVTGTHVNIGAGITGQPTNVFMVKGTTSPSIVPKSPNWTPN